MSTANYSNLIVTIIAAAYRQFGKPETREQVLDQAAWVRCRVDDIRNGRPIDRAPQPKRASPERDDAWSDLGGI